MMNDPLACVSITPAGSHDSVVLELLAFSILFASQLANVFEILYFS